MTLDLPLCIIIIFLKSTTSVRLSEILIEILFYFYFLLVLSQSGFVVSLEFQGFIPFFKPGVAHSLSLIIEFDS